MHNSNLWQSSSVEEEVKEQIPRIQASAIRLVECQSECQTWLTFAESQFRPTGIKNEPIEFDAVVEKLSLLLNTKLTFAIVRPLKEEPYAQLYSFGKCFFINFTMLFNNHCCHVLSRCLLGQVVAKPIRLTKFHHNQITLLISSCNATGCNSRL